MSTPPPIPPDLPEIPGIRPIPVSPAEADPRPPALPQPAAPPVSFNPPVVPPQQKPGGTTQIVLFGCLGLLAVAVIAGIMGVMWVAKKGKEIIDNPAKFAAGQIIAGDPDLELAGEDQAKQTVTIRNRKTGETTTVSIEDLKHGKLTMKNSDGSSAEVGGDGIRVKDKDGSEAVIGAGSTVPLPEWVPGYPGQHQVLVSSHKVKGLNHTGQYAFSTSDSIDTVAITYGSVLEAAEFQVVRETTAMDRDKLVTLEASAALDGGGSQRISVRVSQPGKETMVHLDYSHQEPAAGGILEK